eukprot:768432-Hanusia_phi.AAC.3
MDSVFNVPLVRCGNSSSSLRLEEEQRRRKGGGQTSVSDCEDVEALKLKVFELEVGLVLSPRMRLSRELQQKLDSAQYDFSRMNMEEESSLVLEKIMSDMQYELTNERSLNTKLQEEVRSFRSQMEELHQEKIDLQDFFETSLRSTKTELLETESELKRTKQELFESKCELKQMVEVSKMDLQQLNILSLEHDKFMKQHREVEMENRRLKTALEEQTAALQSFRFDPAMSRLEQTLTKISQDFQRDQALGHVKERQADKLRIAAMQSRAAMDLVQLAARNICKEVDEIFITSDQIRRELFASSIHRIGELETLLAEMRSKDVHASPPLDAYLLLSSLVLASLVLLFYQLYLLPSLEKIAKLESTCSSAHEDLASCRLQLDDLKEEHSISTAQLDKQLKRAREAECKLAGETIRNQKMDEQAKRKLEEMQEEIGKLQEKLEEKVKEEDEKGRLQLERIGQEESRRRELEEKIKELEEEIKELEERRRLGQERVRQLEDKVKEQDELVTELEEKIEEEDKARQELEETMQEQKRRSEQELEKLRELEEKVKEQDETIVDLERLMEEEERSREELERLRDDRETSRGLLEDKTREVDEAREEIRKHEKIRKEREEEREDLIREVERLQDKCADLEHKLREEESKYRMVEENADRELAGKLKQLGEMEKRVNELDVMVRKSHEEREQATNSRQLQMSELEASRSELLEQVKQMHQQLSDKEAAQDELEAKLEALGDEMRRLQEHYNDVLSNRNDDVSQQVLAALQEAENKVAMLSAETQALTHKLEMLESEREEQCASISRLEAERSELNEAMRVNGEMLALSDRLVTEAESNLDQLESRQRVLSEWISQNKNENENRDFAMRTLEEEHRHVVNRCNMLELTMKSMEMEKEALFFENHEIKDAFKRASCEQSLLVKRLENAEKCSWILLQEIENTTEDVEYIVVSFQACVEGEAETRAQRSREAEHRQGGGCGVRERGDGLVLAVEWLQGITESLSATAEAVVASMEEAVDAIGRRRGLCAIAASPPSLSSSPRRD